MAIRSQFGEDEENKKTTNLESGVIGGGAPVAPQAGTAAKGTGWTNLQQYLDTNKGAGTAIADAQLGGINKEIGTTKDAINSWATSANKNIENGTRKDGWSDKINGASAEQINERFGGANAQAFDAWKNLGNYFNKNASGQLVDDATKDNGYQDAYNKNENTWEKIENANTLKGQQQLAKDVFGGGGKNYSTGMSALDSFVARGDAQGKFDAFQTGNANFNDTLKNNVSTMNTNIGNAKTTGAANYKNVMDTIGARLKGFTTEAGTRATTANTASQAKVDANNTPIDGMSNLLGIDGNDYRTVLNANDMYTQADVDALNRLGGMDDDDTTGSYTRGANAGNSGFDDTTFAADKGEALKRFTEALNPTPAPATSPVSNSGLTEEEAKAYGIPWAPPAPVAPPKASPAGTSRKTVQR